MNNITKIVKDSNELKQVIQVVLNEYNRNENFNLGLLDIKILENGEIQLDIPLEEREENSNLQRLYVTYIKDDGTPKPIDYLQELENNVNSLAQGIYNPNDGWQTTGFEFVELPDKEIVLQTVVQKSFTKKR